MNRNLINASNGSGEAVRASITAIRSAGATTNVVDSVTNWPTNFIATSGKELTDGTLSPSSVLVFSGHLSGSNIIIDALAPGYTDTLGNSVGDVIVLKPTTLWADNISNFLAASLDTDGTLLAGAVDNSAAIASGVVTPAKWTNPYKFSAYRNTAYAFPSGVIAKVPLETESYDSNNNYDSVTNFRYTVPVNGFYSFSACVNMLVLPSTHMLASIYVNGVEKRRGNELNSRNATDNAAVTVSPPPIQLTAGDYVELYAYQDQGSTASLNHDGEFFTYFGGYLVSQT